MSGYIFNCFKERVTTGPLCSPSVHATDVLTEAAALSSAARGRQRLAHIYTETMRRPRNIKVHFHF